jgi:hypothetical protein
MSRYWRKALIRPSRRSNTNALKELTSALVRKAAN